MDRYLQQEMHISLKNKNGMDAREFVIKEVIGAGASCVVYRAECEVEPGVFTEHLLKEYNPKLFFLKRKNNGELIIETPEEQEQFETGLLRFEQGCRKQLWFREEITELKNPTANIEGIYSGNGTKYVVMPYFNGCTYGEIKDLTLYRLFLHMRDLTTAIQYYHENGYYHLDIKPDNIFVCPFIQTEVLMLFDFDSVTERSAVQTAVLSYTQGWAAPEQILPGCSHKICAATDIYAIGEIIFHKVMGRHSNEWDRLSFSEYEFDKTQPLFSNVNPKVFAVLSELFRKTINVNVSKRYQSAQELVDRLEELIELANPKTPYLVSNCPVPKEFFVGRDRELEEIRERLENDSVVFLHGIGGIGKSELAKQYAVRYGDLYDTILFAPYMGDAESLVVSDTAIPIHNFRRVEGEDDYYVRKLTTLKALISQNAKRILIIVDNFDTGKENDIKIFLELGCKMLVTSRENFSNYGVSQIDVEALQNPNDVQMIFERYYTGMLSEEDKNSVKEIIRTVAGHTMAVELIAKQIAAEWATPEEILSKLKAAGLGGIGSESVDSSKDNEFITKSTYEHIRALFDLSIFEKQKDENTIYILANLSLFPYMGIAFDLFADWCELEKHGGKACVNSLIKKGWITRTATKDGHTISLHPVVADIASKLIKEEPERVSTILEKSLSDLGKGNFTDFSRTKYCFDCAMYIADSLIMYGIEKKAVLIYLSSAYWNRGEILVSTYEVRRIQKYYDTAISILKKGLPDTRKELIGVYETSTFLLLEYFPDTAESMVRNALDLLKDTGKEENRMRLRVNILLGQVYMSQRKYREAEKQVWLSLGEHSLSLANVQDIMLIISLAGNLGAVYACEKKYKASEVCYRAMKRIAKKFYGKNSMTYAELSCGLARLYYDMKKYEKSIERYEKILRICLQNSGTVYLATAYAYVGLAKNYMAIGGNEIFRAVEMFDKALDIYRKIRGEVSKEIFEIYHSLGRIHNELNNMENAEYFLKRAADIAKRLDTGIDKDEIVDIYHWLGVICAEQKKYSHAKYYFNKVSELRFEQYGYSVETADAYCRLGIVYLYKSDLETARKNLWTAEVILERIFEEDDVFVKNMKEIISKVQQRKYDVKWLDEKLKTGFYGV